MSKYDQGPTLIESLKQGKKSFFNLGLRQLLYGFVHCKAFCYSSIPTNVKSNISASLARLCLLPGLSQQMGVSPGWISHLILALQDKKGYHHTPTAVDTMSGFDTS